MIIRDLHTWEKDEKTLAVAEKLIHFLISDEPTKDLEDLDQVAIPENLSKKFYEFDVSEMEKEKSKEDIKEIAR